MSKEHIDTWATAALAAFLRRCAMQVAAQMERDAQELRRWAR